MDLLPGKQAAERVAGMLNPKYQVHRFSVHVTARQVYSVDPVGQLDFSGSEYAPAGMLEIASQRRQPEDRYGWWDLGRGCYFVECNESLELAEDEIALLEPEERLQRAGATHAPIFLRGRTAPILTLVYVDIPRLQIKQNARISRLRLFRLSPATLRLSAKVRAAAGKPRKATKKKSARRAK